MHKGICCSINPKEDIIPPWHCVFIIIYSERQHIQIGNNISIWIRSLACLYACTVDWFRSRLYSTTTSVLWFDLSTVYRVDWETTRASRRAGLSTMEFALAIFWSMRKERNSSFPFLTCSHMSMASATSSATQKEHVAVLCASFSWQKLAPSWGNLLL